MEPDRFQNHHMLYIIGMICLVLCLSFFFFSLYIIPFLIWHLDYNVPTPVIYITAYMQEGYNFSLIGSNFIAWLAFFVPSLVFGLISYVISNYIDNQIYHIGASESNEETGQKGVSPLMNKRIRESAGFGFKILMLMIVILILVFFLQYLVTT